MRIYSPFAFAVCLSLCAVTNTQAQSQEPTKYKGWNAYALKNELVQLHVVPEIGGRVIQYALGDKEFFWINPALTGKTSPDTGLDAEGEWLNYGGDKLWPAPQGWDNEEQWPGPPDAVLDGQPYRAERVGDAVAIRLTSRDDPRSGIRFSRLIRLHPNSTRVTVAATMTNIDQRPRRWGIWAHMQLDAGVRDSDDFNRRMRAWCPLNPNSHFEKGYNVIFGDKENRSFRVDARQQLLNVNYRYQVGKVGLDSDAGWVATVDGGQGTVFVQRFTFEPGKEYPDGSSVEFWHNGLGRIYAYNQWMEMTDDRGENPYVFESELLSPFARLQPGESYSWPYEWAACRIGGDFPVIDCSDAGLVSQPLACQRLEGRLLCRGRFGVFHLGQLALEAYDTDGKRLVSKTVVSAATPSAPVLLDEWLDWTPTLHTVTLVLSDNTGNKIGQLAQVDLR